MTDKKWYTYAESLDQYIVASENPEAGIPSGWSIDKECGLMSQGELALIWARSGAGKSTLMLNLIANSPHIPTVFFNMEMRARTMAEWLAAMSIDLGVGYKAVKDIILGGPGGHPSYDLLMQQLEKMREVNAPLLWLAEPRSPSLDEFTEVLADITVETGIRPQRVFIDHLNLMAGARDYEGVVRMGEGLHQWAQDNELLVICAQQTGRNGGASGERNDGHIPVTLSSGVYGGEHDADWILGAWRPERDPKFRKPASDFKKEGEYLAVQQERRRVKGLTHLAVIKNRPFGDLLEDGISLWWNTETRRLEENDTGTSSGFGTLRGSAGGVPHPAAAGTHQGQHSPQAVRSPSWASQRSS